MKTSKKNPTSSKMIWLVACMALLFAFAGCKKVNQAPKVSVTTVVSGLNGVMGIETDRSGNIWVSEGGTDVANESGDTHNNNGKVIVITPNGQQYDAIINLASYANANSGELQGTVHILLDRDKLYVLSGDSLYTADLSHFRPGDKPIDAYTLPAEDIFGVISKIATPNNPDKDSHPYNLTKGPDGDLYITDAGANAIIHRKGRNNYSILAGIPQIANTTPGFGPFVQPVPTSIRFDGKDFLVTTLTGFPFPAKQATIFKVSMSGNVSVYQTGFTMLVDQAEGISSNHVFVQYTASFNPAAGFAPNSGSIVWANGSSTKVLADGLNQPVSIKQVNNYTWYVTCLGDGSVLKVTYE